jgi:two-component system, OmpR family, copper resistance phosphate regulon response regulator CusR
VLTAEDDSRIASLLERGLRANGFRVTPAARRADALRLVSQQAFDLVVVDGELGGGAGGVDFLEEVVTAAEGVPVLALATAETCERVRAAVDDCVVKPFRFDELLARARLLLGVDDAALLTAGSAALDLRTRRAIVDGRSVDLSARELALAEVLFRHAGLAVGREELLTHVWGYDFPVASNVVDVYVGHLRRKLGKDRIESIRGVGYRLVER